MAGGFTTYIGNHRNLWSSSVGDRTRRSIGNDMSIQTIIYIYIYILVGGFNPFEKYKWNWIISRSRSKFIPDQLWASTIAADLPILTIHGFHDFQMVELVTWYILTSTPQPTYFSRCFPWRKKGRPTLPNESPIENNKQPMDNQEQINYKTTHAHTQTHFTRVLPLPGCQRQVKV